MQNVIMGVVAARYDEDCASISTEEALSPLLDVLEELAAGGAAPHRPGQRAHRRRVDLRQGQPTIARERIRAST